MTLEKMGTRVEDGESRIYLFLLLVQRSDETNPRKDGLQSGARQTFALYNNLKVPTTYYVCESYIENATKD